CGRRARVLRCSTWTAGTAAESTHDAGDAGPAHGPARPKVYRRGSGALGGWGRERLGRPGAPRRTRARWSATRGGVSPSVSPDADHPPSPELRGVTTEATICNCE